jgi:hypothetical protein
MPVAERQRGTAAVWLVLLLAAVDNRPDRDCVSWPERALTRVG